MEAFICWRHRNQIFQLSASGIGNLEAAIIQLMPTYLLPDKEEEIRDAYFRCPKENSRFLFVDMCQRLFQNRKRHEIVEHEKWYCDILSNEKKRERLIKSWIIDRNDLLKECSRIFDHTTKQALSNEIKNQHLQLEKEKSEALHKKLRNWRTSEKEKIEKMLKDLDEINSNVRKEIAAETTKKKEKDAKIKLKLNFSGWMYFGMSYPTSPSHLVSFD
ncbi:hypothetical protein HELRODRAFT_158680 [Helobdella robusta]|uniref:Uncharacterized protein n=1 Tax=Helobdella robusta TaxID=6412 RepID=T1EN44_HELRO|nr:hypothetical protein HELRODRAFT_158680 [Helobdella robusta]ESO12213.1 hypothetical protein HELRODRAFT_158680 [Helobdella robusta]